MAFALIAAADGRRLTVEPDRPVVLKVKRGDQSGGEIVVGIKDGRPYLDNRSTAMCSVNGIERAAAALAAGDELQLGALAFRLDGPPAEPEVVEPAPIRPSTDSDRIRQQRRISASRMAAIEPTSQSSGLLKRVSAAISGRAERQRLEQIEAERRAVLIEAGRLALSEGSSLGLSAESVAALNRGKQVTLRPAQLAGLARWRDDRQRLVRLDAEIAALRQALGLGADPDAVILTTPRLRSDEQAKVERAYATMDAVGTQEMDGDAADPPTRRP